MKFDYKYSGTSAVINNANSSSMSFAPDLSREPTYFVGNLQRHIPFREAISALHHVVVSDLRFQPRDLSDYKAWLKEQEPLWLGETLKNLPKLESKIENLSKELRGVRKEKDKIMSPFYKAQSAYFKHLFKTNMNMWYILDPVITIHPDQLFFECFSKDESTYAKLACNYDAFQGINEFSYGTTNIDYSNELYNEFQKIRDYKNTTLKVEPSGFTLSTTNEEDFKEVKIDLPDSWVRGFLQVSSAMTLPSTEFDLQPMDLFNFCSILRRNKEHTGPRSIRFQLTPGKPIVAIFEPWNTKVVCPRSIFKGNEAKEIRIWGRRRLLVLEKLLPIAKSIRVNLLGSGMPSFYTANLGDMNFTLGLSGWTANDWSRIGNFDLMASRAEVDSMTQQKVFLALKENWFEDVTSLSKRLNLDKGTVSSALSAFTQAGRAIFDMDKKVYRIRELSKDLLPTAKLRFSNDREKDAHDLVSKNLVKVKRAIDNEGNIDLSGTIKDKSQAITTKIKIDLDDRLSTGSCSCYFFKSNKLYKGPCEHMLALRIAEVKDSQITSTSIF